MTSYIYEQSGRAVGFVNGRFIHHMHGRAIGQLNGAHVHRLRGQYVGELDSQMVLDKHLGNLGNIGNLEIRAIWAVPAILILRPTRCSGVRHDVVATDPARPRCGHACRLGGRSLRGPGRRGRPPRPFPMGAVGQAVVTLAD